MKKKTKTNIGKSSKIINTKDKKLKNKNIKKEMIKEE